MNKEIWKPITGYEGYYEVSNKDLDLFKKMVDEGYSNKKMIERFNCSSDIIATRKYQYKKGII